MNFGLFWYSAAINLPVWVPSKSWTHTQCLEVSRYNDQSDDSAVRQAQQLKLFKTFSRFALWHLVHWTHKTQSLQTCFQAKKASLEEPRAGKRWLPRQVNQPNRNTRPSHHCRAQPWSARRQIGSEFTLPGGNRVITGQICVRAFLA